VPITLAVIHLELAGARLDLAGVVLPGHFVVQFRAAKGEPELIDVFEAGAT